ncbi:hypothetical protein TNCV_2457531 [Trichonephila clavipes]|nr:hypothetical protein TNCV_2457531 [Trichonephila clavipes]
MLLRGRIIGKVEGRPQCDKSVAAEFRNCQHRFTTLEIFQNYRKQISGGSVSSTRTTPADDRYIVLQARRNRLQTEGEIARHDTGDWTTDIAFYRGQKTARWGVCLHDALYGVYLTPAHRRRRSLWCWEHRNWERQ